MATQIKLRRDTYQNWFDNNPVLGLAEPGYDTTNKKLKIGDGTTAWRLLPYFDDKETDFSAVAQNILPSVDSNGTTGYTLGSPSFKWKELFVSNGSIYIGDVKLSNVGGKLVAVKVVNPGEDDEEEDPDDSDATSEIGNGNGIQLPSQSGQQGKFLTTDGSDLSWSNVTGGGGLTIITPEDYEVQDVTTLAFTGAGVTVNKVDDVTTVDIPGGGSSDTLTHAASGNTAAIGNNTFQLNIDNDDGSNILYSLNAQGMMTLTPGEESYTDAGIEVVGNSYRISAVTSVSLQTANSDPNPSTANNATFSIGKNGGTITLTRSGGSGWNRQWTFGTDGDLTLPANGDILDSNGNSVLGGGSNSYTPDNEDNWETVPNNIQAALNELAARVTALQNYEIDGGNAFTPPQGELLIDGNGA